MTIHPTHVSTPPPVPTGRQRRLSSPLRLSRLVAGLVAGLGLGAPAMAVEFGPDGMFSITGFAEVSLTRTNNQCDKCQFDPEPDRQRIWADDVVPGRPLFNKDVAFTQVQPYLTAKRKLGGGFEVEGALSQRWRDGSPDVRGFWYAKNVALTHEDYGSLRIGAMTTRSWGITDYPYASPFGLSNAFAATGAGYGMLTRAIRYTSRVMDVAAGDLVLEGTYDTGDTAFKIHKPSFLELWAHYGRPSLTIDAMVQSTRNGGPVAWGHAPFKGPAYSPADDAKVGGSSQGIAMVLARYRFDNRVELTGGIRRNRWSGAYASIINPVGPQWNNMFNVDWGGTLNGVANPGYPARSTDLMAGLSLRMDKWVGSTGMVYLGKASTSNPLERGQSNSALVNTARVGYDVLPGVQLYAQAGMVHFAKQGLAPLTMPSNFAIQKIDPRTTKAGNWFGVGMLYVF